MKKLFKLQVFMLAIIFIFIGCNQDSPSNTGETSSVENQNPSQGEFENRLDTIKESGKLVIGPDGNYPPFGYHKQVDGQDVITGFDIFIAEEIAKDLGVELEIVDIEFAATLTGVQSGLLDIAIGAINPTPERKEVMDFSDNYYESTFTVLVNKDDMGKFDTIEKLSESQATVGVQTATVQEQIANNIEGITVVSLAKTPDLTLQLQSGLIDAIITENTVADLYAAFNDDLYVEENSDVGESQGKLGVAVAVQKNQDDLLNEINKTIQRLKDEGKIEEYYEKALVDFTSQE